MSRLDFGILGFLWCTGEKEEKAKYLFELAKTSAKNKMSFSSPTKTSFEDKEEGKIIVWTNRNMKYIFKRMFEFSIDLPYNAYGDFES